MPFALDKFKVSEKSVVHENSEAFAVFANPLRFEIFCPFLDGCRGQSLLAAKFAKDPIPPWYRNITTPMRLHPIVSAHDPDVALFAPSPPWWMSQD